MKKDEEEYLGWWIDNFGHRNVSGSESVDLMEHALSLEINLKDGRQLFHEDLGDLESGGRDDEVALRAKDARKETRDRNLLQQIDERLGGREEEHLQDA